MIEIRDLSFAYGFEELVFDNAELSLASGLWLLSGKNGAGKSTFFDILTSDAEKRLQIGVSPASLVRCSEKIMCIKGDITFPNTKERDCAEYIFWLNDIAENEPYVPLHANRTLGTYSKGERKTATFHMLSYLSPEVLLVDEYLNNLDQDNLDRVFHWLEKMVSNGTIVIVASNEEDIKSRFKLRIEIVDKKFVKSAASTADRLPGGIGS
jgi:ABC-type multidrug transport system ATPase subunit